MSVPNGCSPVGGSLVGVESGLNISVSQIMCPIPTKNSMPKSITNPTIKDGLRNAYFLMGVMRSSLNWFHPLFLEGFIESGEANDSAIYVFLTLILGSSNGYRTSSRKVAPAIPKMMTITIPRITKKSESRMAWKRISPIPG